jgi:eukaryotic-like serine/threonine-protein kinase
VADPTSSPPAGWYPDPEGGPNPRYWDGERWTDRYRVPAGHRLAEPADPPRRLRTLRTVAIAGLILISLTELNNISADGQYIEVADELLDGGQPTLDEITDAEDRVDQASIAILVAYLGLGIFTFIPWFHRAYSNLPKLGVSDLRYGTGWAIGAWFIPIFNLFRPKQIANDIDRASATDALVTTNAWHQRAPGRLLHWWWGLFLLSGFLANFAARAIINAADDEFLATRREALDALEQERTGFALDAFASVVAIVAAILAIQVIRRITTNQDAVIDRLEAGGEPASPAPAAGAAVADSAE